MEAVLVDKEQFRAAVVQAVGNIVKHGDTDIFPFPIENHAVYDNEHAFVELVIEYDNNFTEYLTRFSPYNVSSLTPVTYSGFRWATQLDPIWNAHFLASVLALTADIEQARIPTSANTVFSYRFKPDAKSGDLFDRDTGWPQFMEHSVNLCEQSQYVVICDISEFYPRLGHHRLENALKHIARETPYPKRIMTFLSNFSNHNSFGLPVGG